MNKESIKYSLRNSVRKWLSKPTVTRDGNSFVLMDGHWLLLSGPWHKYLLSRETNYPIVDRQRPLEIAVALDGPPKVSLPEHAKWTKVRWVNITQSMRSSVVNNYPLLRDKVKTFEGFYCEDGHLPLTIDDKPVEWLY